MLPFQHLQATHILVNISNSASDQVGTRTRYETDQDESSRRYSIVKFVIMDTIRVKIASIALTLA